MDSTTVTHTLSERAVGPGPVRSMTLKVWGIIQWCARSKISLTVVHISRFGNVEVDRLSQPSTFHVIQPLLALQGNVIWVDGSNDNAAKPLLDHFLNVHYDIKSMYLSL